MASDCACEKHRTSKYSQYTISNDELISRFIFDPIHRSKKGKFKPSVFTHVHEKGCSVQRDIAENKEIIDFVKKFLGGKDNRAWVGVFHAKCKDIRLITIDDTEKRSVCVFDTAEKDNPAHAELFQSCNLDEADEIELRANLFKAFGNGTLDTPQNYRNGQVFDRLPTELQNRPLITAQKR